MTTLSLRSFLGILPFAATVAVTACGGSIIGGGNGAGTSTVPCNGDCPVDPPPSAANAIAVRASQLGWGSTTSSSSSGGWGGSSSGWGTGGTGGTTTWTTGTWTGSGGTGNSTTTTASGSTGGTGGWTGSSGTTTTGENCTDGCGGGYPGYPGGPEMLFLEIGNPAPTCSVPQPGVSCGVQYSVSIGIPPELQQPGVIALDTPELVSVFSETGAPYGSNSSNCPGGGGSFVGGTLSIESIDAYSVRFTLAGTQGLELGAGSVDGSYVATRCP